MAPGWEPGVTFAANHFLAVVLLSQHAKRGLDDAASQAEDQVERRLLLDVVVGQCAAVFQLLAGEDQTLLVRGDALLVLVKNLHIRNLVQIQETGKVLRNLDS